MPPPVLATPKANGRPPTGPDAINCSGWLNGVRDGCEQGEQHGAAERQAHRDHRRRQRYRRRYGPGLRGSRRRGEDRKSVGEGKEGEPGEGTRSGNTKAKYRGLVENGRCMVRRQNGPYNDSVKYDK